MNSYFASCEQQANPHLRGRPVGVCEHLGGIIIAPSVEAKRLGIKLGTPVWEARKIYPKIVLLPVDPDKYRHITASFLRILHDYTDKVEKYSIDEAFADITEISTPALGEKENRTWDNALMLGLEIKQRIRQEIGEWVSCSIGIGPNKLLAKIAADLGEGDIDRIFVIRAEDIPTLYARLKLTDLPGIGPRLERSLHQFGIFSLRQLRDYPLANLLNRFGVNGYFLHELAKFNFIDIIARSFVPKQSHNQWDRLGLRPRDDSIGDEMKSMGHAYTLPKPIREIREIRGLMLKLSEKIGRRMRRKGARGNIVHYFHSGPSFNPPPHEGEERSGSGFSKQHKIKELINDGREIYQVAWRIFSQNCHSGAPTFEVGAIASQKIEILSAIALRAEASGARAIKIMGISVSGLIFDKPEEPLFVQYKKPRWVVGAMDRINDKYGEFTIRRGRLLNIDPQWAEDTVGFGRMKEFNSSPIPN